MPAITEKEIDWLALEGCDIIGFQPGAVVAYDVAGYDRIPRHELPPGSFEVREAPRPEEKPAPAPAQFEDVPYLVRVAGLRRHNLFGPDQIGSIFARLGIPWNDGLGNGLYESLLIDRKYGLAHTLEAPAMGFSLPFIEAEWPAFRKSYPRRVRQMADRFEELEMVYGSPLARREPGLCVLWCRESPLALFASAWGRDANAVGEALIRAIGQDAPPIDPVTSEERIRLAKFWAFIRARHSRLLEFQAEIVRSVLGRGTKIVGNAHELPPVDLEGFGRIYDHPGLAMRPLLVADEVLLRHYFAYYTQLFRDLSGRSPLVSVRVNLSAAGCRFMPSESLIRRWHDQAVRHGAGGFYLWPRDYPSDVGRAPYDGPIPGNPDPSTRPQVRWETQLALLGKLATHGRFRPPPAQVAILVPCDAALTHRREWRRIYAAFSACVEAHLHTRFVSDRQIIQAGIPDGVRLLIAPVLEFLSPGLRAALDHFTGGGGKLFITDQDCWDGDGKPAAPLTGAQNIDTELFDIFPLDDLASLDALARSAATIRAEVARCRVNTLSWVFDISCANLPPVGGFELRTTDPEVQFEHWLYEHGSDWILPYFASNSK